MITTVLVRVTEPRLRAVAAGHRVWTSLEGENPGGSIKDRMVRAEVERAFAAGELGPGGRVSEISAGSTALSLALLAKERGLACALFVPVGLAAPMREKLEGSGAELHFRTPEVGYAAYEEYCLANPTWRLDQMKRPGLEDHYAVWARREIAPRLPRPDWLVGAVGTGHSLRGLAEGLNPALGSVSAEPAEVRRVNGIRNLRLERFGAEDPCSPEAFSRRVEISAGAQFPVGELEVDGGRISFPESFQVVLGAVEVLAAESSRGPLDIFAVGAGNRWS